MEGGYHGILLFWNFPWRTGETHKLQLWLPKHEKDVKIFLCLYFFLQAPMFVLSYKVTIFYKYLVLETFICDVVKLIK